MVSGATASLPDFVKSYSDAVGVLRSLGSADEPNLCVRPFARRWLGLLGEIEAVDDGIDRRSSMVTLPGLANILVSPILRLTEKQYAAKKDTMPDPLLLLGTPRAWSRDPACTIDPSLSMSLEVYKGLHTIAYPCIQGVSPKTFAGLRTAAGAVTSDRTQPSEELSTAMRSLAIDAARSLRRVRDMMGPRNEQTTNELLAAVKSGPGSAARLRTAVMSCVAAGAGEELVASAASELRSRMVLFDSDDFRERDSAYRAAMRYGGCHYGSEYYGHSNMVSMSTAALEMVDVADEVVRRPVGVLSGPSRLLLSGDWGGRMSNHARSVSWYVSRARRPPKLWS